MRLAIETFTTIIVVTISCILLSSMISIAAQESDAREFFDVMRSDIEDSDYNSNVIENCKSEAKKKGYKLNVNDLSVSEKRKGLYMTLYYDVTLPVYGIIGGNGDKRGMIQGYAR
jgi:hypothetical protein